MSQAVTDIRTIAIIAHVDHGKTTLVDGLFNQLGVYHSKQETQERAMDSMDQERERGITILAKCTSVQYKQTLLQLVDTPGHADFGGEVERTLRMVNGVLLLVDAAEGPMPQTRFVLRKAMELGLPAVVAINKIDRSDARAPEVLDECYDLFIDLGANESQIEFPVIYTNGRAGTATHNIDVPGTDLIPLVETLVETMPSTPVDPDTPFQMQINQLGYDDYLGKLAIGRIISGSIKPNQTIVLKQAEKQSNQRITGIFTFLGPQRIPIDEAHSGQIVAISGIQPGLIGDTICVNENQEALPGIKVDEPTVAVVLRVNDGPLAGRSGGKYVTSRHLRDRLYREQLGNVSIKIQDTDTADSFRVMGRGELQLSVLIETLRRELFEFCVCNPEVVTQEIDGEQNEPMERLHVDVPNEYVGILNELLGPRKAQMSDQKLEGSRSRLEYLIPTRGLFGLRGTLLTATRGTIIMSHVFEKWIPWCGPIPQRKPGALVADRNGTTTPYALHNLQPRGTMFCPVATLVYEGMIIGEHNRDNDLNVNCVREKKLTNVRASGKDDASVVSPPREMSLEQCLEWIRDDEVLEITPEAIRIRKRILPANLRPVLKSEKA
ncbi:MAG: translational GTPase TypA [Myxococcota bacterium]|nr:translational GTPase TypA [Myxococcota bacterium]